MFYSEDTALWGFIAHIPIAVIFLAFLSRQVTLREKGQSLLQVIFDQKSRRVLNRAIFGGLVGLVFITTLSPISRFILH